MKRSSRNLIWSRSFFLAIVIGLTGLIGACDPSPPIPEVEEDPLPDPAPPIGYGQDEIGGDPGPIPVYPGVVEYVELMEEAQAEEPAVVDEQFVLAAMTHLHTALADIVEEDYLEAPREQPGLIDQPAGRDDPGAEEVDQDLVVTEVMDQELELLDSHIAEMEASVDDMTFPMHMKAAMSAATEVFAALHADRFPRYQVELREIRSSLEAVESDTPVSEQRQEILDFLNTKAEVLGPLEMRIRLELRGDI